MLRFCYMLVSSQGLLTSGRLVFLEQRFCISNYASMLQMEGMVNDLQLAREKHAVFADWKAEQSRTLPYDMVVSVLTTGFWPTYKVSSRLHFWPQ